MRRLARSVRPHMQACSAKTWIPAILVKLGIVHCAANAGPAIIVLFRLYADQLAAEGFLVLLPDVFHGDAIKEGFDKDQFMEWKKKHSQDTQLHQLDRLLTDVHQQYKPKSVSAIGFCWGGRHACILAESDKVSSAVVAHGSFVTKEIVEAVKQPILFLFADKACLYSALASHKLTCTCQLSPALQTTWAGMI